MDHTEVIWHTEVKHENELYRREIDSPQAFDVPIFWHIEQAPQIFPSQIQNTEGSLNCVTP